MTFDFDWSDFAERHGIATFCTLVAERIEPRQVTGVEQDWMVAAMRDGGEALSELVTTDGFAPDPLEVLVGWTEHETAGDLDEYAAIVRCIGPSAALELAELA